VLTETAAIITVEKMLRPRPESSLTAFDVCTSQFGENNTAEGGRSFIP
jgi:hypothetical protein